MKDLVKALEHIETLDGTEDEVHIVNMSMGQHDSPPGLSRAINRLADSKILIASAGWYSPNCQWKNLLNWPTKAEEYSLVLCLIIYK